MSRTNTLIANSRRHLQEAREGYFEHLAFATLVSALLLSAAIACLLHALVPGLCRTSASRIVTLLVELFADRSRRKQTAGAASGPLVLTGLLLLGVPPVLIMLSAGAHALLVPIVLLCLGVPLAYLWNNRDLDPVS